VQTYQQYKDNGEMLDFLRAASFHVKIGAVPREEEEEEGDDGDE